MQPWDALLLSVAAGLVAMHLAHGLASAFVSLGAISPKHEPWLRRGTKIWGYVVTVGFLLPPVVAWVSWALT
jgi:succinate dehydrogenase/fumarate reductase cytochrome b subunit